jgi:hypothetical protein
MSLLLMTTIRRADNEKALRLGGSVQARPMYTICSLFAICSFRAGGAVLSPRWLSYCEVNSVLTQKPPRLGAGRPRPFALVLRARLSVACPSRFRMKENRPLNGSTENETTAIRAAIAFSIAGSASPIHIRPRRLLSEPDLLSKSVICTVAILLRFTNHIARPLYGEMRSVHCAYRGPKWTGGRRSAARPRYTASRRPKPPSIRPHASNCSSSLNDGLIWRKSRCSNDLQAIRPPARSPCADAYCPDSPSSAFGKPAKRHCIIRGTV